MKLVDVEQRLADLIRTHPVGARVTWRWVETTATELGCDVTRQWLDRNAVVAAAYRARKAQGPRVGTKATDGEFVARLKEQLRQRDETIREYEKRFLRYIHNATERGVTIEQMEAPIPGLE